MNISIPTPLKSRIFFTIILSTIFLLIFNEPAAAQAKTQKQDFNVQGMGTFVSEFTLQSVGNVIITADWQGAFPGTLTLKDPLDKIQKQQKGSSPIKLEFSVTQQFLNKGGKWKITFYYESRLSTKGTITITHPAPTAAPPQQGWCCSDGKIFSTTIEECRKQGGQFFRTREEAEQHCRQEHPRPEEPQEHPRQEEPEEGWCCKDGRIFPTTAAECREQRGQFFPTREEAEQHCLQERPRPEEPEEGWCCKDGRIFPTTAAECREQRGQFFPTREEAEQHCLQERPRPEEPEEHPRSEEPEEGWCCKDDRVFPTTAEECREQRGQFFPSREEAEQHCRQERPRPEEPQEHPRPGEHPRPEEPKEGWCCKDGQVFPAHLLECCEGRGHFFETREEAEEHCREKRPHPEEHPRPEGGWCCKDGEVFPAREAECAERGGQFYVCEEDARRYCPGPKPRHEITPPPPPLPPLPHRRPYPAVPTANLDVEGLVPLDILEKVANAHAYEIWGEEIAPGSPFPVADREGNVFAYAFHYIRGSRQFPGYEPIFDRVRSRQQDSELAQMGEQFGYIYVSATDKNFPILMVSHYLHPYFLVGDLAQEQANRHFDSDMVRLDKIYFLNPHDEYFEFISNGKSIVFNVNSLEKKSTAEALDVEPLVHMTDEHMRKIKEAWERAINLQPVGTPAEEAARSHTEKKILHWNRLPPIPHTWWCVPTSQANILGFWDNYAKGSGTFLGYGRLIKYWFEHPTYCHLSSGAQANCQWSSAIHNNVPDIIDVIIDPQTGTWRQGFTDFVDFVSKIYKYKFSDGSVTPSASNDWAWNDVKKEVDNGRPAFWAFQKHCVAAIGYRITNSGQKLVIIYDSYGVTFPQKTKEYAYDWCNGFRWVIPGGGTSGDHMIIDSPDGGETLSLMVPYDITWWVWGVKITKSTISFSADGGRNWSTIASNVNTTLGKNSYQWLPDKAAAKGRIRIDCYSSSNDLIAADGSEKDFTVQAAPLNSWDSWKSMGKLPITGDYGFERIVVGQNQDGRLEVFGIGSDGGLWNNYQTSPNSSSWSGWADMGKPSGLLLSTAAVGRNQDGRLEVAAIASDGALWHRYQPVPNKGPWVQWDSMDKPTGGIKLVANPVIAQNQDGRLEVFAFGSDGALWHRYQPAPSVGPWSSWSSLGKPPDNGKFYGNPAIIRDKDGRLEVFALAGTPGQGEFQLSNTALWQNFQPNPNHKGSWGQWQSLGKPSNASWPVPAAGQNKDGRMEVYVPGSDGALWHKYQQKPGTGSWSGWSSMSNPPGDTKVLSQIEPAANKDGRIEVFIFGIKGLGPSSVTAPWHIWQILPNNGWSQWAGLGTPAGKDFDSLTVGQNKDGRLEVFAIAVDDNSLWHICQK